MHCCLPIFTFPPSSPPPPPLFAPLISSSLSPFSLHSLGMLHGSSSLVLQLVKGEEVVLTFSCSSTLERDDWMESFRVLKQLALPCNLEHHSPTQPGQGKVISTKTAIGATYHYRERHLPLKKNVIIFNCNCV